MKFIYNESREVAVEETDANLKRLIRSFDLWASECTQEKTWYHYASDEQGSTIFIADREEVKNRYEYDAWGNVTECEEQVENRYKYTGQQYDPITQQYYLRARYYNPVIARFTQEDEYRGDGLNLYAYCANNPVMYYDPSGYACNKDVLGKNPKTRLPKTEGIWQGYPGEGKWYSNKPEVKKITKGEGVEYSGGRPNFSPWKEGDPILFKKGELNGTKTDFNKVYDKIKDSQGLKSRSQAEKWLKDRGLTPHHKSSTEIELIPTGLHGNVPHIGSASDMRGGFRSEYKG